LSGLVAYCHQPRKPSLVIQNLQDTSTLIHNRRYYGRRSLNVCFVFG
jgi:hypothetical protein